MIDNNKIFMCLSSKLVSSVVEPLNTKEFLELTEKLASSNRALNDLSRLSDYEFTELLGYPITEANRIRLLLKREDKLNYYLRMINEKGVYVVTYLDRLYPKAIKEVLKEKAPAMFYYAGNLELLNKRLVGFTGSRDANELDKIYAETQVDHLIKCGYNVVTGGANGIDKIASNRAIFDGGSSVEFLSGALLTRANDYTILDALREGRMLLISSEIPNATFDIISAIDRNKYIYISSCATVVIKTGLKMGGTWSGAMEALNKGYGKVLCWDNFQYEGNQELIKNGANKVGYLLDTKLL